MTSLKNNNLSRIVGPLVLLVLGVVLVGFGWLIPSRFKSIPRAILHEAGVRSASIVDLAEMAVEEEEEAGGGGVVVAAVAPTEVVVEEAARVLRQAFTLLDRTTVKLIVRFL